jgi:hypothetical protein
VILRARAAEMGSHALGLHCIEAAGAAQLGVQHSSNSQVQGRRQLPTRKPVPRQRSAGSLRRELQDPQLRVLFVREQLPGVRGHHFPADPSLAWNGMLVSVLVTGQVCLTCFAGITDCQAPHMPRVSL